MPPLPLDEVRWLSIAEIAEYWAPERGTPSSLILRELQLAILNLERFKQREDRIDELPPEGQWPPTTTTLTREQLEEFCEKQRWNKPAFWFRTPETSRPRGRPSHKRAIVQELNRISENGELKPTVSEQARHLADWVREQYPDRDPPTADTVENMIRESFKILKATD